MHAKLINDEKNQSYLKDQTKFLIEDTLTTVIEVIEGKKLNEWDSNRIEQINKYRSFPKSKFIYERKDRDGNNRMIIEYCDAVNLLKEYYASAPYGSQYKSKIVDSQKTSGELHEEFVPNQFRKEFDIQCENERKILEILAVTRNKEMVHSIETANMGEIYMWIRQLMKYLESFIGYRMQVLSRYDDNFGKIEDIERLELYYTKASELKEECFASKENYKEFRFGKNTYKVAKDDKEDFLLLIADMARRWNIGIEYLKLDKTKNLFDDVLAEYVEDYDIVMEYEKIYKRFETTTKGSTDESILYMAILYKIGIGLNGIYWKGKRYSESYFASLVLQVLTRHPDRYTEDAKRETFEYRIKNFEEWSEEGEKQKGLGINLLLLCKEGVLASYFEGKRDKEGVLLAKAFEKNIINCLDRDFINENYDKVIESVLSLTTHMKGCITYMSPIPKEKEGEKTYLIFHDVDEFRRYFVEFVSEAENLDEIGRFVNIIRNDKNFSWFLENSELFEGKEV